MHVWSGGLVDGRRSDTVPRDDAAHIAVHELGHDAEAAIDLLDEVAAACAAGDGAAAGALIERLRRGLERFRRDAERLVASRGGDLDVVTRRPTNLAGVVDTVVSTHPTGRHIVEVDCARVLLNVDPVKVERIVDNLLASALRHTPSRCAVRIRLTAVPGGAVLVAEDDGPGLPEHLAQVINVGEEDPAAFGGAVGLWLVVRFTRLHGGHVSVSRTSGDSGARFDVWLPAH